MKTIVRAFALMPAITLLIACQSDVKPVGDALAEDSTLALAVLGARPDSVDDIVDLTDMPQDPATDSPPRVAEVTPSAAPAVAPVVEPARRMSPRRVAPKAQTVQARPVSSRTVSRRTVQSRPANRSRSVRASQPAQPSQTVQVVASRGWLLLPAGSEIELESEQRICNANSGDGFEAVVAEDVVMANGVIIPEGAVARGTVVSGSGIQPVVDVAWITFGGHMYEVNSRVTHVDSKRSRSKSYCIPDGGRIIAELTSPLRVRLTE